jgi:hypothetical protein
VTRAALARILLALVLLAGWQAALVHPLEHVDEHGHLVHAGDGHGDKSDPAAKLCDALSALTACAASDAAVAVVAFSQENGFTVVARVLRKADPPPFLSQGPPALL